MEINKKLWCIFYLVRNTLKDLNKIGKDGWEIIFYAIAKDKVFIGSCFFYCPYQSH